MLHCLMFTRVYSVVFTPKDEELKTKKVEGFVKDILAHLKETAGITLRG